MAEYLERLPANCGVAVDDSCLSGKPLAVISAETAEPAVRAGHEALARASSLGRHVLADGSGHWVQLDRPDVIAAEVRMFTMEGRSPKEVA